MTDVTADANIYISALQFDGVPLEFLSRARNGDFRLFTSDPILDDVARVLRDKFSWELDRLTEAIVDLAAFTTEVAPTMTLAVIEADPDDDRILECAVASSSQYIVTGDKDLLRLGAYNSIQIVTVADFLKLLESPPETLTANQQP